MVFERNHFTAHVPARCWAYTAVVDASESGRFRGSAGLIHGTAPSTMYPSTLQRIVVTARPMFRHASSDRCRVGSVDAVTCTVLFDSGIACYQPQGISAISSSAGLLERCGARRGACVRTRSSVVRPDAGRKTGPRSGDGAAGLQQRVSLLVLPGLLKKR